ncbi:phosphotriesterase-related protein [Neobacillus niacini]|uniref:phosphotriesterase family protein n=1 Tax=Neobacillus niacini TaxID=86668 RepID=UPI003000D2D5
MAIINSVQGPISSSDLGKTLIHEHFLFGYPGYQGDHTLGEYNHEEALQAGIEAVKKMQAYGIKTVLDPTPNDCGRNPLLLKEISEKTGLQIICTTGYYCEEEGSPAYFKWRFHLSDGENQIYEMFKKEVTEGIGDTGIKAGAIKLASSRDRITDYEKVFFKAAVRVQKETGIPIITHTQYGTMGPEQAELLVNEGADPQNVLIGHMCGNTDIDYHIKTLSYGVNIGFDRFGVQGFPGIPTDNDRIVTLLALLDKGYGNRVMLSQDTVNFFLGRKVEWPEYLKKLLANYHPTNIFENILPVLREKGVEEQLLNQIFTENPQNFFTAKSSVYQG